MTLWDHILAFLGIRRRDRYPATGHEYLWIQELHRQLLILGIPEEHPKYRIMLKAMRSTAETRYEQPAFVTRLGLAQAETIASKGNYGIIAKVVEGLLSSMAIIEHEVLHGILVSQFGLHEHPRFEYHRPDGETVNIPKGVLRVSPERWA